MQQKLLVFMLIFWATGELSAATEVRSSITGRIWLDRNLGAQRVCQSIDDAACFGDYYQWGRAADGHEKASSSVRTVEAKKIAVAHSDFIALTDDWTAHDGGGTVREKQWNPCPRGYRVPTVTELRTEFFDKREKLLVMPFKSVLKIPASGFRYGYVDGSMQSQGEEGTLWSSSFDHVKNSGAWSIVFGKNRVSMQIDYRSNGFPVRCIKAR